jgi:hypothetical protein
MWCPECSSIQVLKAVPAAYITGEARDHNQRWYRKDYPDIHWFQRGRECLKCGHSFLTGEAQLTMLQELAELRDALASVKRNAEKYIEESEAAAEALTDLQQSLSILRALRIYKQA